jgi:hypothetical protein
MDKQKGLEWAWQQLDVEMVRVMVVGLVFEMEVLLVHGWE